jgi:small conductance mechanosensitive channel
LTGNIAKITIMSAPEMTLRIISSSLIVLVGLGIGFWLRRLLVLRLKKTVLDDWLIQILGVVIILLSLMIAAATSFGVLTNGLDKLIGLLQQFPPTSHLGVNEVTSFAWNLVWTLLVVVFSIGIARTLSKLIMRGLGESRLDINLRTLISRFSHLLVLLIGAFWALSLWQVAIVLPVAVLGTLTLAFTFSVQDILKDLVAGLYILLERPFYIGEQISTDKYTGRVVGVELRATRLRLVSGEEVTVPNALVFGGIVINNSRYAERRATITITMPLADFERHQTPEQILTSLKELEEVLEKPEPAVTVSGIAGDDVELTLRFWIATGQLATVTDVVYALRTLLPSADLSVKETAGDV